MDIGGWLRSLGLEEYETAFRENKVDVVVLPKLTAEELKDLGVAAVGDRRKLLEAIADLRLGTEPIPYTTAAPAKDTTAERRQVRCRLQIMLFSLGHLANSSAGPRRGPASARTNKDLKGAPARGRPPSCFRGWPVPSIARPI
jgi:hypothetical protein